MEAIRGNGSLLEDGGPYSTHDGETRSLNISFSCNGTITGVTFIAVLGNSSGKDGTGLEIVNPDTGEPRSSANTSSAEKLGRFRYQMTVSMEFIAGDIFRIQHPLHSDSVHKLLYQPGDQSCTSTQSDCGDQPLLAVRAGSYRVLL